MVGAKYLGVIGCAYLIVSVLQTLLVVYTRKRWEVLGSSEVLITGYGGGVGCRGGGRLVALLCLFAGNLVPICKHILVR